MVFEITDLNTSFSEIGGSINNAGQRVVHSDLEYIIFALAFCALAYVVYVAVRALVAQE